MFNSLDGKWQEKISTWFNGLKIFTFKDLREQAN